MNSENKVTFISKEEFVERAGSLEAAIDTKVEVMNSEPVIISVNDDPAILNIDVKSDIIKNKTIVIDFKEAPTREEIEALIKANALEKSPTAESEVYVIDEEPIGFTESGEEVAKTEFVSKEYEELSSQINKNLESTAKVNLEPTTETSTINEAKQMEDGLKTKIDFISNTRQVMSGVEAEEYKQRVSHKLAQQEEIKSGKSKVFIETVDISKTKKILQEAIRKARLEKEKLYNSTKRVAAQETSSTQESKLNVSELTTEVNINSEVTTEETFNQNANTN